MSSKFLVRIILALLLTGPVWADSGTAPDQNSGSAITFNSLEGTERLRFAPVVLKGGSKLTLITPEVWAPLGQRVSKILVDTHREFSDLFGNIPPFSTSVRLIEEESFFESTGAPRWTNAMFYKGQIFIPLPATGKLDLDNTFRSIRHEFTHAIIHALSAGRCPGWLDEGIAQWSEGEENPALKPALLEWLLNREPLPLSLLQNGFTKLDNGIVAAAYAQSLYAANSMISRYTFEKIGRYLRELGRGTEKSEAFKTAFGASAESFEAELGHSLNTWKAGALD